MARKYVSNKDESVRIFKSDLLERLSHVHPAVPHVIYVPVVIYMVYWSRWSGLQASRIALLFTLGVLLWTLVEYIVHRSLFHATPELEDELQRIVGGLEPGEPALPKLRTLRQKQYFLAHGVHHDFPNDSKRLVMPPSVSLPLAVLFYVALRWVLGPADGPAALAGLVSGYLVYDTIHYAMHHFSLRGRVLLELKKHHFRHHYADATRDYGVSSPLWDLVLGTLGERRPAEEAAA
jgi:sterol desaturase/sphingolipid hydroxylase (fatty acid hydroxylase superfamily)